MGKSIYLSYEEAETIYHMARNTLESNDLTEEECLNYEKLSAKTLKVITDTHQSNRRNIVISV